MGTLKDARLIAAHTAHGRAYDAARKRGRPHEAALRIAEHAAKEAAEKVSREDVALTASLVVMVTEKTEEQLEAMAERKKVTKSEIVRRAITAYLRRY